MIKTTCNVLAFIFDLIGEVFISLLVVALMGLFTSLLVCIGTETSYILSIVSGAATVWLGVEFFKKAVCDIKCNFERRFA